MLFKFLLVSGILELFPIKKHVNNILSIKEYNGKVMSLLKIVYLLKYITTKNLHTMKSSKLLNCAINIWSLVGKSRSLFNVFKLV